MAQELYEGSDTRKSMVSASSQYSTSYKPEEAFDGIGQGQGDSGNCWLSLSVNGPNPDGSCYLEWDFNVPLKIVKVQMCRRDDAGTENFPKNFKVLSSNTGVFAGEEEDYGIYQNNDATFGEWSNWYTISGTSSARRYLRIEIHSKWDSGTANTWVAVKEVRFYISIFAGYFSGYVYEESESNPVNREVYCYRRDSGALINSTTSSGNGYYYLETTYSGSHFIVALDDEAGTQYNLAALDYMVPVTIS